MSHWYLWRWRSDDRESRKNPRAYGEQAVGVWFGLFPNIWGRARLDIADRRVNIKKQNWTEAVAVPNVYSVYDRFQ